MDHEFHELKNISLFSQLQDQYLETASLLWSIRELPGSETLWLQGEPATELAIVVEGELNVHINDEHLATVPSGELIGELATFTKDMRSASVSAEVPCRLLTIPLESLEVLRDTHQEMYDSILNSALHKASKRIHEMDIRISKEAFGSESVPSRRKDNAISQFFKRFSGTANRKAPPATSVLRKLPRLKKAPKEEVRKILSVMTPHHIPKGQPLFLEGETGRSGFLLVEGCIDVIRNVDDGMAERLATLYPGALLGTGALLLEERRNAACVASQTTDVWVYEMDPGSHRELEGEAGRLWRESLLVALAFQLRNADERLVAVIQGARPKMTDFDKVRSSLLGYQG